MSGHPHLTWGDLKAWAETQQVPDDAVIQDDNDQKFRDLDYWPGDDGGAATFVLQHRWG